jgi:hypothetical protein
VVFNRLLQVELHETLFNVALKERHGKRLAAITQLSSDLIPEIPHS